MLEQLPVLAVHGINYYSKLYAIKFREPKYIQGQGEDRLLYTVLFSQTLLPGD